MGITPKDIAAQRAMIERGEEKRKRLRDKFASAALTGLLSNIPRYQLGVIAVQAYDIADEMLRERLRHGVAAKQLKDAEDFVAIREQFLAWQKEQSVGVTEMDSVADRKSVATPRACASSCSQPFDSAPTTHDTPPQSRAGKNVAKTVQEVSKCTERENDHDAAPDARARDADRVRTDKATTRPGNGTGNTPSEAEIDALEFVVEEGRIGNYGILRSWLIRLRPEWESQSYEESDEKRVNATMNRNATHDEGSVRSEGTVGERLVERLSITQAMLADNETLQAENARLREAIRSLADQDGTLSVQGGNVTVTMDATLTDEEREAVAWAARAAADPTPVAWYAPQIAATLRGLLERTK
jgi:hypothetical protein